MPDVNGMTFAGLDALWVSFVNSAGIMNGFANVSAPGASSGMRKMKAAQSLPSAIPTPNRKVIKADDIPYDQFLFSADTLPGGDIKMGANDFALAAAAQNSTLWTLGNWLMAIYGIGAPTLPNLMVLGHTQAHSQDAGSTGQAGFKNILIPNVQMLPTGESAPAYQAEGDESYGATFLPFTVFPFGNLLDNTNFSVIDGTKVEWFSKYRTLFFGAIGDGSAVAFVVPWTPVDVASTKAYGTHAGVTSLLTVSTVVPSTKTITLSAAPASGDNVVIMLEVSKLT